jgi:multidrug efflux pump subunit AcrA (membrane-fusion protein)
MTLSARKRLRAVAAGLVVIGAMSLSACKEVEEESAAGYEPSKLEPIKGKGEEFQRVTFTEEGAARVDLQTDKVTRSGEHKVIPYEALIYNDEAKTFVYTTSKPLSYERVPITVDRVEDDRVLLSKGPAPGTKVVTVGATEVYGAELDIAGSH